MELPLEVCDLRFVQWPGFGKHRLELLGPHDGHVVNAPPSSGQSASTKHSTPRTGTSGRSARAARTRGARRPSAFSHAPGASVGLLVLDEPTKVGPSQALYAQPAQPGSSRPSAGRGAVRWRVWSVQVAPGRARGAAMLLARATAFGGCLPVAAEAGEVQCAVSLRLVVLAGDGGGPTAGSAATWLGERRPGDARSSGGPGRWAVASWLRP